MTMGIKMRTVIKIVSLLLVALTTACGGGGGSAGTTSGSSSTGSTTTTVVIGTPTVTLQLLDANNAVTTSISGGGISTATAKVVDADGKVVANRLVGFVADAALVKLNPVSGSVLTNASGVASIQISALSLLVSGASTIKATALIGTSAYSGSLDYQVSATNLALRSLNLGSGALAAYGNRAITVQATANGNPVTSPVQVSFVASCGSITATANTDSSGIASATYKADSQNCAGTNVNISASTVGASPLSGQISVSPTAATNLQFVSTAPTLIYLRDSGAATQALVTFKVVDSNGNPQQNQAISLTFVNSSPGVSMETVGNTAAVVKTSDATGNISVAVFSGTVPTPVQVRATLVANTSVTTTSGILTVASGRPVQKAASIGSVKAALEGFDLDGDTTAVTLSIADRQGNPVPDGTVVNFVSQSGVMIPPTCVVAGGTSRCTSSIRSQGTRPANGRVSILAYVQGEEDFVDANFNNVYDPGEAFTDMGNAYRSDANDQSTPSVNALSSSWTYKAGEFTVPRSGSTVCSGGESGRPDTCDGVWGANEVRKQHMVIFSTTLAVASSVSAGVSTISLYISDTKGNSVPTGSTLGASKISGPDACAVSTVTPSVIPNSYDPYPVVIDLKGCTVGSVIAFTVTTPVTNTVNSFRFTLK
jgi:hypothetical protein